MIRYTLEMAQTGEVTEFFAESDAAALDHATTTIDPEAEFETGDWEADGQNDDGQTMARCLIWADAASAVNDPGAKSIAQVCRVGNP